MTLLIKGVYREGAFYPTEPVALAENTAVSMLSIVEVYSAFNRLVRERRLTQRVYQDLTVILGRLFDSRYELIPLSTLLELLHATYWKDTSCVHTTQCI